MNIVLIGYRGTGKSIIGRRIAERLQIPFYDTDELIKKHTGKTIREIVEEKGWEAFRKEEKETIKRLSTVKKSVIATGGGAVMDEENLDVLKKMGVFVWLSADVGTIIERMGRDKVSGEQRPALSDNDLYRETVDVLEMRTPIYRRLADITIDTSKKSIDEIVDEVCRFFKKHNYSATKSPRHKA
ncbi:MAG: shikimate kinase [Proteobacteria bacterium]|nr:shikimate kinase [Pseudomonadota bacterium]